MANIVQELLENEKTYIDKLTTGIKVYVEPLRGKNLPPSLRGQMYYIFANIVQIRDFHEQMFYPSLLGCNSDVQKLSDTFSQYIQVSETRVTIYRGISNRESLELLSIYRMVISTAMCCML